jgi:hypothetical protein
MSASILRDSVEVQKVILQIGNKTGTVISRNSLNEQKSMPIP